ncbi:MAG TPA: hypothetical protein VER35_01580 [Candidatus Limnocylindrales bacterium]|nr:hypothetical protein [Candidatus Limnocylindrales bacterium]
MNAEMRGCKIMSRANQQLPRQHNNKPESRKVHEDANKARWGDVRSCNTDQVNTTEQAPRTTFT